MDVYLSNDKELLKAIAEYHNNEYDYSDIYAIEKIGILIHTDPTINITISQNKPGYKIVHSKGTSYANIKQNEIKAYSVIQNLANNPENTFYNLFSPNNNGQLSFYLLKFRMKIQNAKRIWCSEINKKKVEESINESLDDDQFDQTAKAYLSELIINEYAKTTQLLNDNHLNLVESYLLNCLIDDEKKWKEKSLHYYYLLRCKIDGISANYYTSSDTEKIQNIEVAEEIQQKLISEKVYVLKRYTKEAIEKAPSLFNKKELMKNLNVKSRSHQKRIDNILDNLYSLGHITNPNTNAIGIKANELNTIGNRLNALENIGHYKNRIKYIKSKKKLAIKSSDIIKSDNIRDSGIMPTVICPILDKIDAETYRVYDMIVKRFLMLLASDKIVHKRFIYGVLPDHSKIKGDVTNIITYGFKAMNCETTEELEELITEENSYKDKKSDESTTIEDVTIKQSHSKDKPKITYQYLLKRLDRKNNRMSKAYKLQSFPVGSNTKQLEAIQNLISYGVIIENSNEFELAEISSNISETMVDKEVTEEIYGIIFDMKNGKVTMNSGTSKCINKINEFYEFGKYKKTNELPINYDELIDEKCPICKTTLFVGDKNILCTNCSFEIWKNIKNHTLTVQEIRKLIALEETKEIIGFTFKNTKYGKAKLKYDTQEKRVKFIFT